MKHSHERAVSEVPRPVIYLLIAALCFQVASQAMRPAPTATAASLGTPASRSVLRVVDLGDPIALAQGLTLYLQAFDNQPGISIPFRNLDYPRVIRWLDTILALDPDTQYPLLMASELYGQVPVESKQRLMFEFVHRKFLEDPDRRWRWLAHCAILAKHRLRDPALALRYAEDITRYARGASDWARQMRIFILEDMGELQSATVLLGGLLASGEIKDPREIHFLTQRLQMLKKAEKSSRPSKSRH